MDRKAVLPSERFRTAQKQGHCRITTGNHPAGPAPITEVETGAPGGQAEPGEKPGLPSARPSGQGCLPAPSDLLCPALGSGGRLPRRAGLPPPRHGSWRPGWKPLSRALAAVLRPCLDPGGGSPSQTAEAERGFVFPESLAVGRSQPDSAGTVKPCFLEYEICSFPLSPGPPAGSTSFPRSPAPWPLPAPSPLPKPQQAAVVQRGGLQGSASPPIFIKVLLVKLTPNSP